MSNHLPFGKQVAVINCLAEGCSIRSAERMTGVHRDTIMRLLVRVGAGCLDILDETMRGLDCKRLELDEAWTFVGVKQARIKPKHDPARVGDFYVFTGIDRDTKLIPAFRVGKRDGVNARAFLLDLRSRLATRPQVTTDAANFYADAIEGAFGSDVDAAQLTKVYDTDLPEGAMRYAPPRVVGVRIAVFQGAPDPAYISTSFIERSNWTLRTFLRRMTRLSNGFSRKPENLRAAVAVCIAWYDFCKVHRTLRVTPAMEAGITDSVWTVEDLVRMALKPAAVAA